MTVSFLHVASAVRPQPGRGERARGAGATCDRHHPFIRLYDTGRAHPARLKRDAHLQSCAAVCVLDVPRWLSLLPWRGCSTGRHSSGAVPPETRPHSRGAVVSVECSSRTLPKSWQLCRKCNLHRGSGGCHQQCQSVLWARDEFGRAGRSSGMPPPTRLDGPAQLNYAGLNVRKR